MFNVFKIKDELRLQNMLSICTNLLDCTILIYSGIYLSEGYNAL